MRILVSRQKRDPNNPDEWSFQNSEKIHGDWKADTIQQIFKDKMYMNKHITQWEAFVFEFDFETQTFDLCFKCHGERQPRRILNAD